MRTRSSLKAGGILLYLARQQQPRALGAAGFVHVERLLDKGGMALYSALA